MTTGHDDLQSRRLEAVRASFESFYGPERRAGGVSLDQVDLRARRALFRFTW